MNAKAKPQAVTEKPLEQQVKTDPLDDAMREIRKMKRVIVELEALFESIEAEIKIKDAALTKAGVFLWNYYREQHKRMDGHIALALKMAAHEADAALSPTYEAKEP